MNPDSYGALEETASIDHSNSSSTRVLVHVAISPIKQALIVNVFPKFKDEHQTVQRDMIDLSLFPPFPFGASDVVMFRSSMETAAGSWTVMSGSAGGSSDVRMTLDQKNREKKSSTRYSYRALCVKLSFALYFERHRR